MDVGAIGFGLLDLLDHTAVGGVGAGVRDPDAQVAEPGEGRRVDPAARPGLDRQRFAGDGRLVHGGLPIEHLAVGRDLLAGADNDDVAGAELVDRQLDLCPVTVHARGARGERGQRLEAAPGAVGREPFDGITDAHEEDHHQRRHPLPDCDRREHADRHQGVRDDLAVQGRADHVAEDGVAGDQHQRQPDRPGHELGDALEDAQPFTHDRDEQHNAKQRRQQQAKLPRQGAARGLDGCRVRCCDAVSRPFHRVPDRVLAHLCGIEPDGRLLGREKYIHGNHTGQRGDRVAHVFGALGAVHAGDGDFKQTGFTHGGIIAWWGAGKP